MKRVSPTVSLPPVRANNFNMIRIVNHNNQTEYEKDIYYTQVDDDRD